MRKLLIGTMVVSLMVLTAGFASATTPTPLAFTSTAGTLYFYTTGAAPTTTTTVPVSIPSPTTPPTPTAPTVAADTGAVIILDEVFGTDGVPNVYYGLLTTSAAAPIGVQTFNIGATYDSTNKVYLINGSTDPTIATATTYSLIATGSSIAKRADTLAAKVHNQYPSYESIELTGSIVVTTATSTPTLATTTYTFKGTLFDTDE
jgi:hypothetical protein